MNTSDSHSDPLGLPIESLNFNADKRMRSRLINAFRLEGILTIGDLVGCEEYHLTRIPNLGLKALLLAKEALAALGLTLKESTGQSIEPIEQRLRFQYAWMTYPKDNTADMRAVAEHFFKLGYAAKQRLDASL